MKRILLADDHSVVRRGLRDILSSEEAKSQIGEVQIGEAKTSEEAQSLLHAQAWDYVILDLCMPGRGGMEVLESSQQLYPSTPVLIVTAYPEQDYALRAFNAGAMAYIHKSNAAEEILAALRLVSSGHKYVSPMLAEQLIDNLEGAMKLAPHELLSDRELEVFRLIAAGKSLRDIAALMHVSDKTVSVYRRRITQKMGMETNVQIMHYATEHHLLIGS